MAQTNQKLNRNDLGDLHPMEIDLILTLRHDFPFGQVEIEMRDGLPQYLLKTINRRKLGNFQVINRVDLKKLYPELHTKMIKNGYSH